MQNVVAIMGSPRKNKNSDLLLDSILEGLDKEVFNIKRIYLRDLNIGHCRACDYCGRTGQCIIKDDMDMLYEEFDKSSTIILSAPLYFNSLNGLTKNMIDRCQRYWSIKYSLGQNYRRGQDRIGIFLSSGGAAFSHNQFEATIPVVDFFYRAINAKYIGNYFVSNTDIEDIKDRPEIRGELNLIGKNLLSKKKFRIQR